MIIELVDHGHQRVACDTLPPRTQHDIMTALCPVLDIHGHRYPLDYTMFRRLLSGEALTNGEHPVQPVDVLGEAADGNTVLCLLINELPPNGTVLSLPEGRLVEQPCRLFVGQATGRNAPVNAYREGVEYCDGQITRYVSATLRYSLLTSTARHVADVLMTALNDAPTPERADACLASQDIAAQLALSETPDPQEMTQAIATISRLITDASEAHKLADYIAGKAQAQRELAEGYQQQAVELLRQVQARKDGQATAGNTPPAEEASSPVL